MSAAAGSGAGASEEKVYVMNLELAKLGTAYPNTHGDEGLLSMLRCYYHFQGSDPKLADFSSYAKDDEEGKTVRRLFGPVVVRGPNRQATKNVAIAKFLLESGLVSTPPKPEGNAGTADDGGPASWRTEDFPYGTRHVHFVGWDQHKKAAMEKLVQRMYSPYDQVYRGDFMLVGSYLREADWTVCVHDLDDPTVPAGASWHDKREHAVEQHATHCLRKRYSKEPRPQDAERQLWASMGFEGDRTAKVCKAFNIQEGNLEQKALKAWTTLHPYFKNVRYKKGGTGVIPLTAAEVKRLPKRLAKMWKFVQDRTIQQADWDEFNAYVRDRMKTMCMTMAAGKQDMADASLCTQWTFYEMLKACVSPPVPRSAGNALEIPNLSQEGQTLGAVMRNYMYKVTKATAGKSSTPSPSDIVLVMNMAMAPLAAFTRQAHASGKFPVVFHEATQDRPEIATLRGEKHIEAFLKEVAKAVVVPFDFLLASQEAKEDDVEFSTWTLPAQGGMQQAAVPLGL